MAEIIGNDNPSLTLLMKEQDPKEYDNPKGTIVSWFLQEHERRLLERVIEFLKTKKLIVKNQAVLCFDGIQVLDNQKNNDALLKELELHIFKMTGFEMKFKIKPFDILPYTQELEKIDVPDTEPDDDFRIVEDEKEAANILYEELESRLKYCNNQIFFKFENIWSSNTKLLIQL